MPVYRTPDQIQADERDARARGYLAQARLYADVANEEKAERGSFADPSADSVATMHALLAIAEMLVPLEPADRIK